MYYATGGAVLVVKAKAGQVHVALPVHLHVAVLEAIAGVYGNGIFKLIAFWSEGHDDFSSCGDGLAKVGA